MVEAHIPAGATDETIFVGIRIPSSIPDGGVPRWAKKTSRIYEFGATKANGEKLLRFLVPVTIKIPYSAADISGMNADNLRIYRYSEDKSEWRAVNTSFVDTSARKVGAEIPGFSLYAIMEYLPGREELISFDGTYVYPNPTRGSKAHFKYYLGDKADVTIEIYNVAGIGMGRVARRQRSLYLENRGALGFGSRKVAKEKAGRHKLSQLKNPCYVIPAKAGIQIFRRSMDSSPNVFIGDNNTRE